MDAYEFSDSKKTKLNKWLRKRDKEATLLKEKSVLFAPRKRQRLPCREVDDECKVEKPTRKGSDKLNKCIIASSGVVKVNAASILAKISEINTRTKKLGVPDLDLCKFNYPHNIAFHEESHKYNIKGLVFRGSATSIIHSPFKEFNEDEVASSLASKHVRGYYHGMSKQDILDDWEEARQLGTLIHLWIELALNGIYYEDLPASVLGTEYEYFMKFWKEEMPKRKWYPELTEVILYDHDAEACGMIDFIAWTPDPTVPGGKRYILIDWKRTRNLKFTSFSGEYGKWPCENIQDCNGGHYIMQLNLYAYWLKKYRGITITEMFIARFHPNCNDFELHKIPPKQQEVKSLLMARRQNLYRIDINYWKELIVDYIQSSKGTTSAMSELLLNARIQSSESRMSSLLRIFQAWIRLAYRTHDSFWKQSLSIVKVGDINIDLETEDSDAGVKLYSKNTQVITECKNEDFIFKILSLLILKTHRYFESFILCLLEKESSEKIHSLYSNVIACFKKWDIVFNNEYMWQRAKDPLWSLTRDKTGKTLTRTQRHKPIERYFKQPTSMEDTQANIHPTRTKPGVKPKYKQQSIAQHQNKITSTVPPPAQIQTKPTMKTVCKPKKNPYMIKNTSLKPKINPYRQPNSRKTEKHQSKIDTGREPIISGHSHALGLCYTHTREFPQNHTYMTKPMTLQQCLWHIYNIKVEKNSTYLL